ncbi:BQ5605_C025g10074 [Microbotryum silenes-dioicae]|uniref:BQ5605_C025g10074 protein n=1 Tax=Microbotryum silenes-dioicae TaxID=796604 RepID=A0A2X0MR54_9BASI|nr:BQ5605_C025g10074 [Microbotryum silenes-dioicae]
MKVDSMKKRRTLKESDYDERGSLEDESLIRRVHCSAALRIDDGAPSYSTAIPTFESEEIKLAQTQ